MPRFHESSMHVRPGYEIIYRYLDRQDIVNQLELIAQCIQSFKHEGIIITCTHSTSLIKPNLSADQSLSSLQPVRIAESPQAGPLPTLTVTVKIVQEDLNPDQIRAQLNEVRRQIEQSCENTSFVTGPVYPQQFNEASSAKQIEISIGLPTNRHRIVS